MEAARQALAARRTTGRRPGDTGGELEVEEAYEPAPEGVMEE